MSSSLTPTGSKLADGTVLEYDYLVIATGTHPRPDQTPGLESDEYGTTDPRLLHARRRRRPCRDAAQLEGRTARDQRHRDADQVPGGAARVHVPRRLVLHRQRHPRPGRARLRHPAPRSLHQAGGLQAPRRHARRAQGGARERLLPHGSRRREQEARLLRRARGPLRPARDRAGQHGRRLRRPVRSGRRAEPRAGRQAHVPVEGPRQHLRPGRRRRPANVQGRIGGPLRRRHLHRQLPRLHRGAADARAVRRSRQLLHRVGLRQGPADRLQLRHRAAARASTRCRASAPSRCSKRPR